MTTWTDWLKVIELKPRFLFAIWLVGSLVIFLPEPVAERLGTQEIRETLSPWLGLGTLAAFSFWLVQLIPLYREIRARQRYRAAAIRALDSISPEEWVLVAYCLKQNQQTITLSMIDREACSLEARGLLQRADGIGNRLSWPYTIPTFLWEHLLTNRGQFMGKAPFPRAEVEARLLGLHQHIHRYRV